MKNDWLTLNYTPKGMSSVQGIVIHSMWGTYSGSIAWFKNPEAKASANYCISQTGEITHMVDESKLDMAWHAGYIDVPPAPAWVQPNPNYVCIGVELEDMRDPAWQYPEPQRKATRDLIKSLMSKYSIPKDRVVLHKELNPTRRSDPVGAFSRDWLFGSPEPPPGFISFEQAIIDSYLALKGAISDDEKKWRLDNWQNLKVLLEDLLKNDSGVKTMWFDPVAKEAAAKAVIETGAIWQSKLNTANLKIEELRKLAAADMSWQDLFSIAWKKWWSFKKGGAA